MSDDDFTDLQSAAVVQAARNTPTGVASRRSRVSPPTRPASGKDGSQVRPLRVLAASGDPAVRGLYESALPGLGHQVSVAAKGRQLVEQCRLLRPDLVITEVGLAELDGIAVAEEVCRHQPTPIILVLEEQQAESVQRALANQCVLTCLFKPVKEADLGAAIAMTMCRFEQFESLRREAAELRQALEDRKLIERAKGLVMRHAGVDEEDAYRLLRELASHQNRKLVEVTQAVITAGEVFQQLEHRIGGEREASGAGNTDKGGRTALWRRFAR
jgi:response regulator NasT